MKKSYTLLPLAYAISALLGGHTLSHAAETAMQVEPVFSIRHSDNTAAGLYQLGRLRQSEQQLDQAADAYREALAQDAGHVDARNALATIFSAQKKNDEALAEFQLVLQKHPGLAYVHNNLGYAYFLKADYPAAIAEFGSAIALDPANTRAFANLALVYERLGDASKAQAALLRATATATGLPAITTNPAPVETVVAQAQTVQAPAAATSAPSSPVPPEQSAVNGTPIEISNGTRDTQLAANMADTLQRGGFVVTRITKLAPYTQRRTVILYRDGFYKQAVELRQSFAVPPALVNNTHTRKPSDTSGVRLVLGNASTAQAVQVARLGDSGAAQ